MRITDRCQACPPPRGERRQDRPEQVAGGVVSHTGPGGRVIIGIEAHGAAQLEGALHSAETGRSAGVFHRADNRAASSLIRSIGGGACNAPPLNCGPSTRSPDGGRSLPPSRHRARAGRRWARRVGVWPGDPVAEPPTGRGRLPGRSSPGPLACAAVPWLSENRGPITAPAWHTAAAVSPRRPSSPRTGSSGACPHGPATGTVATPPGRQSGTLAKRQRRTARAPSVLAPPALAPARG